jgi:hypothetical protein
MRAARRKKQIGAKLRAGYFFFAFFATPVVGSFLNFRNGFCFC